MLKKTLLVVLVLCTISGLAAYLLLRPTPQPPAPAKLWLAGLDPASVKELRLAAPGTPRIIREPRLGDVWLVEWPSGDGKTTVRWPAESSRVRGAVRLLADLAPLPAIERADINAATTIELVLIDGSTRRVSFDGTAIGGKVLASIELDSGVHQLLAPANLLSIFSEAGLLAWRTEVAGAPTGVEPDRLRIETPELRIEAARVGSRWALSDPAPIPADSAKMRQYISRLEMLPALHATAGAEVPSRWNVLARLERVPSLGVDAGEQAPPRLVQELRVGGPADARGTRLLALSQAKWVDRAGTETVAWGPVLISVDAASLDAAFPRAIAGVASARAALQPAADVGGIVLAREDGPMVPTAAAPVPTTDLGPRDIRIMRTLDGWAYTPRDGAARVMDAGPSAARASLIQALCEQDATEVMLSPPPQTTKAATITLLSPGGSPLTVLTLGVAPPSGERKTSLVVVRAGALYLGYSPDALKPSLEWLAAELPPEG